MKPLLYACLVLGIVVFAVACSRNAEPPVAASPQPPPSAPEPATPQAPEQAVEPAEQAPPVPEPATPSPAAGENAVEATEDGMAYVPHFFENPDDAGVLAPILEPGTVPAYAQLAYEAAQQDPRLLTQLPCFCYCDRFGHKSLHDCFSSRHAIDCDICQREAVEAVRMVKSGTTPEEIRKFIIQNHRPRTQQ